MQHQFVGGKCILSATRVSELSQLSTSSAQFVAIWIQPRGNHYQERQNLDGEGIRISTNKIITDIFNLCSLIKHN